MITLDSIKSDLGSLTLRVAAFESQNKRKTVATLVGDIDIQQDCVYVGLIVSADRAKSHHIIRLPYERDRLMTWNAAMEYAAQEGAELPDRVEGALLYAKRQAGEFADAYHWTREQGAGDESYAWIQSFDNGYQRSNHKGLKYRVVLVRRITI